MRRWKSGCHSRSGADGSARQEGWRRRTCRRRRGRRPGAIFPLWSVRRLRCGERRVWACARSHVVSDDQPRRYRGSCDAMRRHGAATWTIWRPLRSGTPNGRAVAQSRRNWLPIRRCAHTCRTAWRALSSLRVVSRRLGQQCRGRVDAMVDGRTGAGLRRGARSRLLRDCGSTSRATPPCASATRRSTRHSTSRAGVP